MSYHVYTTDGIILKRTPFGEANILLHILTSDLGLIIASARSARLYVSKLRPALQESAYVSVSCIKGKNGWKITNVASKGSFYFDYPEHTHKVVSQVFLILLKMIVGEIPESNIFTIVMSGLVSLKEINASNVAGFEALIILRILNELGYVGSNSEIENFLENKQDWGSDILELISSNKTSVVSVINKSLKVSQL